ncbi:GntR family transcriptional regulator [Beijerinckia sp. L45]|uniref:GntR family transcriptional regulator n=1 Tax=Beijerinckia sp. L45 TaxID=1641855 RepID=UPI00131E66B2|nr:GntR family transcriptional regulator [Beijerinckia sp. L45]
MSVDYPDTKAGKQGSLSNQAYESLLLLLLAGDLAPGTVLQERRLAENLGISRTPVREALAKLEAQGLVTSRDTRSPIVCKIAVQDFIEILKVRKLLEVEAAGIAAERGIDQKAAKQARDAIATLVSAAQPSPSDHWAVDDLVHGMISEAAQNRFMATTLLDLRRRTHIFDTRQIPERLAPGAAEHLAIVDAVTAGDAAGARRCMAEHLDNVRASIVDRIVAIKQSV